jgi:hypothetical protein
MAEKGSRCFKVRLEVADRYTGGTPPDQYEMSMIALIEPVVIAVMKPFEKAQKRFQTALSN